jgi:recombination protein RecT
MSTQVVTQRQSPVAELRDQMTKMEPEFKRALPPHIPPERFQRVAMTAINRNPDLQHADRKTLMEACMLAAQDGLLPDGREAALVVFNTKKGDQWVKAVQYMPMVAGIRKKVYQSGEITSLVARVARENDHFDVVYGDEERIEHKPNLFNAGEMIAVYAIATYRDGSKAREVMTIDDVNRIRAISRSPEKGPWKDHYEEMAKKTVIRRLSKSLPLSAEADEVIRRDDGFYNLERPQQTVTQIRPVAPAQTIESRLNQFAGEAEPEPDFPESEAFAPTSASDQSAPSESDLTPAHDDGADTQVMPEHLAAAMEQGRLARRSGMTREVPRPLAYVKRKPEAEAFLRGWDEENHEINAVENGTV